MNSRVFPILIIFILLIACSNDNKNVTYSSSSSFETDSVSLRLRYSETCFIVPSPNQTAILLKKYKIRFYDKFTSTAGNLETYTTTTKKSLALGIFGADLSYLNLYEQRETAGKFFQKVQSLMDDLEISPTFDKILLKKVENNFGNNDSMLYYLAELYRNEDINLKTNDRRDICALIIAGGWIESFYFLTQIYSETRKEEIFNLILYQSDILDNLIKLLSPFYEKSTEFTILIDDLVNIAYEFDVVDKISSVISIETDSIDGKTIIQNQTRHMISGTRLKNLAEYASDLRNKIAMQ